MNTNLVIRGTGLVTAMGNSARATWDSLLAGKTISRHSRVHGVPADDAPDRVTTLACAAAHEAIADAGWGRSELESDQTALVVGTSKGPADQWLTAPPVTSDNPAAGRIHLQLPVASCQLPVKCESSVFTGNWQLATGHFMGLHSIAQTLAMRFRFGHGPRLTVSSACATGLHAMIRAAMLLRKGQADRVLIVAAESSLHPLFLQCYQRLGVVASPGELIRPMDQARSGFLVSEAAAAVCLERRPAIPGDVIVERFSLGSDATHLTAMDPAGKTLQRCLAQARGSEPVQLIHAHATGTRLNDPIELAAIGSICAGMSPPNLFSHKGAIGHTLGAAGLISLVLNVFMHRLGTIPPNTNTTRPLEISHARIASNCVERRIHRSLSIAAGFGGATAVVGLQTA